MNKINLLIPMVGTGKRFQNAGYVTYKPFIPIQGKPMVQHVTDAFPNDVKKHIITSITLLTKKQHDFLVNDLACHLIDVSLHQEGPAYSIYQARSQLPLDESFFIAYCDIYWTWNFNEVANHIQEDGIIFTRTGYHPHLVNNNYSAFCLPSKDDQSKLAEICEKSSYTDDWLSEPLSIGAFYVKNGREMMAGIKDTIENDIRISNEFFPSLLFNFLVNNGANIRLHDIDFFIHWGVPEQLNDFLRWKEVLEYEESKHICNQPYFQTNIMMMAGQGRRMQSLSRQPKGLLDIENILLYQHIMKMFPSSSTTIIASPLLHDKLQQLGVPKETIYPLKHQTPSQFDTLINAKNLLCNTSDFFLTSCDAYGIFDPHQLAEFIHKHQPDAIIFTFIPSLMHKKLSAQHTHVTVDGHRVTDVHIKSQTSDNDLGLAGFFWVQDGNIFQSIEETPKNNQLEMSADHVFKYFIDKNYKIMHYTLRQYIHLGTPEEFLEYQYWSKYGNVFKLEERDAQYKHEPVTL